MINITAITLLASTATTLAIRQKYPPHEPVSQAGRTLQVTLPAMINMAAALFLASSLTLFQAVALTTVTTIQLYILAQHFFGLSLTIFNRALEEKEVQDPPPQTLVNEEEINTIPLRLDDYLDRTDLAFKVPPIPPTEFHNCSFPEQVQALDYKKIQKLIEAGRVSLCNSGNLNVYFLSDFPSVVVYSGPSSLLSSRHENYTKAREICAQNNLTRLLVPKSHIFKDTDDSKSAFLVVERVNAPISRIRQRILFRDVLENKPDQYEEIVRQVLLFNNFSHNMFKDFISGHKVRSDNFLLTLDPDHRLALVDITDPSYVDVPSIRNALYLAHSEEQYLKIQKFFNQDYPRHSTLLQQALNRLEYKSQTERISRSTKRIWGEVKASKAPKEQIPMESILKLKTDEAKALALWINANIALMPLIRKRESELASRALTLVSVDPVNKPVSNAMHELFAIEKTPLKTWRRLYNEQNDKKTSMLIYI